jgi:hypothetical protein
MRAIILRRSGWRKRIYEALGAGAAAGRCSVQGRVAGLELQRDRNGAMHSSLGM